MSPARVVVIGGGISGLAAACTLREEARRDGRPVAVTVLEAAPTAGGHAQTTHGGGFVVEHGPNGFLDREPHTLALVEALGLTPRLVTARREAARRYLLRGGRLCAVPSGPGSLLTSPALSWRGKLRLLAEPFAPGPPPHDETVHGFAARRLGAEMADTLVDAAIAGISAGDSRRLAVADQFPRLVEMERRHGSLLRGLFARRPPTPGVPAGPPRLLTLDGGLGVVTGALAATLGRDLVTGAAVTAVSRDDDAWRVTLGDGRVAAADHVVLALPAHAAARLLHTLDLRLASRLADIEYAGLAVAALGYRRADVPHPLDGYGYLAARSERLATLGVVWESSLFPGRAPDGAVLLRVMVGGSRQPDLARAAETAVLAAARVELAAVLGIRAEPVHAEVVRWPEAIAQYTLGHGARRDAIRAAAGRHPGLWLCGTAYDGISFNDAVKSGRECAGRLAARLRDGAGDAAAAPAPLAGVHP